ncbi:MAG: hypothetical protein WC967_12620 [Balneolaceae bacterium]
MKLTINEVSGTIDKIAHNHKNKTFSYYDKDDIYQQVWNICIEALPSFRSDRGEVEHFLRCVVKNRLCNIYNSVNRISRCPCNKCDFYDKDTDECTALGKKEKCKRYESYRLSTETQKRLNSCKSYESIPEGENGFYPTPDMNLMADDLYWEIVHSLPDNYTEDFMRMISGERINSFRKADIRIAVREILNGEKTEED